MQLLPLSAATIRTHSRYSVESRQRNDRRTVTLGAFKAERKDIREFYEVLCLTGHVAASTKSPTLQKSRSIPAAIAEVQRSVPCRFTKL